MTTNIVTAAFGAFKVTRTRQLYQYDYGQILRFAGIELPTTYTVHFSNQQIGGEAVKQVGDVNGVQIPDEMLTSGQNVYAWVFLHTGEDDGETMYAVTIPVQQRPRPTEEEPTPVQQGLIEQAIAALNAGVEVAQEAAESVQDMGVEAETLAPGSAATVEKTVDPETGVVTLEFGIPAGEPGQDGVSPRATVTQTSTGATISITDAEGTTTAEIANGKDGDPGAPGFSPTITVTDIAGGHRVTITDATGPHSFDVMDGTGSVQDVQVAGTSVVQDGVANIPYMSIYDFGVAKAGTYVSVGTDQRLKLNSAAPADCKIGNNYGAPITPYCQHQSAFYGLAKAAGSDEKGSTLPVGQYTDAAKSAIQQMLGISWVELGTVTVASSTNVILFDLPDNVTEIEVFYKIIRSDTTSTYLWICPDTTANHNTFNRIGPSTNPYLWGVCRVWIGKGYVSSFCINGSGANFTNFAGWSNQSWMNEEGYAQFMINKKLAIKLSTGIEAGSTISVKYKTV